MNLHLEYNDTTAMIMFSHLDYLTLYTFYKWFDFEQYKQADARVREVTGHYT